MKIAFVHDRIINMWWAEDVFIHLISQKLKKSDPNNEYKIFTVFSDKKFIEIDWRKVEIDAVISNEFILKKLDYRNFMPIFPILIFLLSRKIKKYKANEILISSFAISKNINICTDAINRVSSSITLYLHSPMQYIWEMYDENINKLKHIKKLAYWLSTKYLRLRDLKQRSFDKIYFNSFYTKKLAEKLYWITWEVYYPKINQDIIETPATNIVHNYYLFIWRLVKFSKELDKIINLFNETWESLLIMWSWPDEDYLKSIANSNIIFLWSVYGEEKLKILKHAKGLINLTKESFGIVTAEALSLGVPVFGFQEWWSKELVDENSWILVQKKDLNSLLEGFEKFQSIEFDRIEIKERFVEKYLNNIN